jgi:hypothetical protein
MATETVKIKRRPLTSAQKGFLRYLSDGKWHPWSGQAITGSGIRGLISRGLIERQCADESPWTWMRHGAFRLKPVDGAARGLETKDE